MVFFGRTRIWEMFSGGNIPWAKPSEISIPAILMWTKGPKRGFDIWHICIDMNIYIYIYTHNMYIMLHMYIIVYIYIYMIIYLELVVSWQMFASPTCEFYQKNWWQNLEQVNWTKRTEVGTGWDLGTGEVFCDHLGFCGKNGWVVQYYNVIPHSYKLVYNPHQL